MANKTNEDTYKPVEKKHAIDTLNNGTYKTPPYIPIEIEIIAEKDSILPTHASPYSAGYDIYANILSLDKALSIKGTGFKVSIDDIAVYNESIVISPHGRCIIPTGLYIALPIGYEAQVRARSGNAIKHGITMANGVGTIDSDYRGEIGVIILNTSNKDVIIRHGDKIAQLIIAKHEFVNFQTSISLPVTDRGNKGYGSSGDKKED